MNAGREFETRTIEMMDKLREQDLAGYSASMGEYQEDLSPQAQHQSTSEDIANHTDQANRSRLGFQLPIMAGGWEFERVLEQINGLKQVIPPEPLARSHTPSLPEGPMVTLPRTDEVHPIIERNRQPGYEFNFSGEYLTAEGLRRRYEFLVFPWSKVPKWLFGLPEIFLDKPIPIPQIFEDEPMPIGRAPLEQLQMQPPVPWDVLLVNQHMPSNHLGVNDFLERIRGIKPSSTQSIRVATGWDGHYGLNMNLFNAVVKESGKLKRKAPVAQAMWDRDVNEPLLRLAFLAHQDHMREKVPHRYVEIMSMPNGLTDYSTTRKELKAFKTDGTDFIMAMRLSSHEWTPPGMPNPEELVLGLFAGSVDLRKVCTLVGTIQNMISTFDNMDWNARVDRSLANFVRQSLTHKKILVDMKKVCTTTLDAYEPVEFFTPVFLVDGCRWYLFLIVHGPDSYQVVKVNDWWADSSTVTGARMILRAIWVVLEWSFKVYLPWLIKDIFSGNFDPIWRHHMQDVLFPKEEAEYSASRACVPYKAYRQNFWGA